MVTLDEWVSTVCQALGIDKPDIRAVLDLTRDVAHRVNRPAAPVTALLAGLAAGSAGELPAVMDKIRELMPPDPDQPASPSR
jgi:hypothetical protein